MNNMSYDLTENKGSKKPDSFVVVENPSVHGSKAALLTRKGSKKRLLEEFWWKIAITLAVIAILSFIVYKVVSDSKTPSGKRENKTFSKDTLEYTAASCAAGSVENSYAYFTFIPLGTPQQPYRAHGLEFPFKELVKKANLGSTLTRLDKVTAHSSRVHYYYNIDRCRIGGGKQTDKKPYIRGPIVFAVNDECSKVYYFQQSGWKQYKSARNMFCSSHGEPSVNTKTVEKSVCEAGSIRNSYSSFTFNPADGSEPYTAQGLEFTFEVLVKKAGLESTLTQLSTTTASSSKIHYYYNIDRCRIGGGIQVYKKPFIRGPIVFAVNEECNNVYYYFKSKWMKYRSARNFTCSSHGKQSKTVNKSVCEEGSIPHSYSSFTFTTFRLQSLTTHGLEFAFDVLVKKPGVESTLTKFSTTTSGNLQIRYYYNADRCRVATGLQTDDKSYNRGPVVFAVDEECSRVYYFSELRREWKVYVSARNIICSSHVKPTTQIDTDTKSACEDGYIAHSHSTFTYVSSTNKKAIPAHGLEVSFEVLANKTKLGSTLTKLNALTAATSKIHYYYNVNRCRNGGRMQLNKKPYIAGPTMFAVNEECSAVYYFPERSGMWRKYLSARNITCSNHGKQATKPEKTNRSVCEEGSIKDSYSYFTFKPAIDSEPYTVKGLEFTFEIVAKKAKLESTLTKLNTTVVSSSRIHYYYNIDRCRIGGGVQLDKKPYIRGAIVFAVDEECSKVFYHSNTSGWRQYKSATNITCSRHGKLFCIKGALDSTKWTFTSPKDQITALEFQYDVLAKKLSNVDTKLKPVDVSNNTEFHYLWNVRTCRAGHKSASLNTTRSPLILAVDSKCTKAYSFDESKELWREQTLAQPMSCSWINHTWCHQDAIVNSSATFEFTNYRLEQIKASGVQYNFTKLLWKLRGLITDDNLDKLHEVKTDRNDVSYFLNVNRCLNGGLENLNAFPPVRGPLYFAVSENCSKVRYFSTQSSQWKTYISARNIQCQQGRK